MSISKHVKSLGVEIEGGISHAHLRHMENTFKNMCVGEDSSVNVPGYEITCIELRFWSTILGEVFGFAREVFAGEFKQNKTCGNHIHLRFKDETWKVLTYPYPWETFICQYKDKFPKAKYITRLLNHFCEGRYNPIFILTQLRTHHRSSARYTAINFNSIYLYGTIEVRIMPGARDFHEYKQMVLFVVRAIEDILRLSFSFTRTFKLRKQLLSEGGTVSCAKLLSAREVNLHKPFWKIHGNLTMTERA